MNLKQKKKEFFESLKNEEDEKKFFGVPVNEEIYGKVKG
jgi:hypothetical protein